MKYIWLIPLLPALGAAINGLIGIRAFSRKLAGLVACGTMTLALGLSLVAFWQLLRLPGPPSTASSGSVSSRAGPRGSLRAR